MVQPWSSNPGACAPAGSFFMKRQSGLKFSTRRSAAKTSAAMNDAAKKIRTATILKKARRYSISGEQNRDRRRLTRCSRVTGGGPDAAQVLASASEALGGEKNLSALRTLVATGAGLNLNFWRAPVRPVRTLLHSFGSITMWSMT